MAGFVDQKGRRPVVVGEDAVGVQVREADKEPSEEEALGADQRQQAAGLVATQNFQGVGRLLKPVLKDTEPGGILAERQERVASQVLPQRRQALAEIPAAQA